MAALILATPSAIAAQDKPTSASGAQVAKAVGTIRSVQSDSITFAGSSGEITAKLSDSTKILRVLPGAKDLKDAIAVRIQDLQPGDGVRVRGRASADAHTITALEVIVVRQADVAAKQQHDREDWQKRGVGGLVTQVDAATGAITISSGGMGANRSIVIHVAGNTTLRRYAQGSVKFDDAKPATIDQLKAGDQLRARGTRSADGGELNAEEIVTGAFRNIAGTIKAIDTASNTITVQDAISKSAVSVRVSSDSQMKKLPTEMAQRIAMRFKRTPVGGNGDQSGTSGQGMSGSGARQGGGPGGNGPPDIQRMLSRLPNSTLADLQRGDAVMIVSAESGDAGSVTAITLLAGVDAILTAAPDRSPASLLSPWSLGGSAGEGDAAP